MKRPKYNNTKYKGYDSLTEYRRSVVLKMLEKQGIISDLKEQVPFVLIPSQYIDGKCIERSLKYIADFVYYENGKLIVEDSKGYRTDEYKIKRKLMLQIHGIQIRET